MFARCVNGLECYAGCRRGFGCATLRAWGDLAGSGPRRTVGSGLQRVTYHYWFHTGEILAIRQVLGHRRLPEFVGNIDEEAPYRPV